MWGTLWESPQMSSTSVGIHGYRPSLLSASLHPVLFPFRLCRLTTVHRVLCRRAGSRGVFLARQVNVPMVSTVQKTVQVPEVQYVDKVVQVPVTKQARALRRCDLLNHRSL